MDSVPVAIPLPRRGLAAPILAVAAALALGRAATPSAEDYAVYSALLRDYPCIPGCLNRWPGRFVVAARTSEPSFPARLEARFDPPPSPQVLLDEEGSFRRRFLHDYHAYSEDHPDIPTLFRFGRVHYGADGRTAWFWAENQTSPGSAARYEVLLVKEGGRWRVTGTADGWRT